MARLEKYRSQLPRRKQSWNLGKMRGLEAKYKANRNAPLVDEQFASEDDCIDEEYDYDPSTPRDKFYFQFQQALESQWKQSTKFLIPNSQSSSSKANPGHENTQTELKRTVPADLVQKLQDLVDEVQRAASHSHFNQSLYLVPQRQVPVSIRRFAEREAAEQPLQPLDWLSLVVLFKPFWIRSADSWTGKGKSSLINHLFVKYPVPDFLIVAWGKFQAAAEEKFKWQRWLIILGQGGSLKLVPGKTLRKMQQYLFEVPWHELPETQPSPGIACLYAEVRRIGGDVCIWKWLTQHPAFAIDPTEVLDENFHAFWFETVNWIIRHRDQLLEEICEKVLDWSIHEITRLTAIGMKFTWKGRTFEATCRSSHEFQRRIIFAGGYYAQYTSLKWQSHSWDWSITEGESEWKIRELTSGVELVYEGKAMRHCVASYARRCAAGFSSIFSLTRNEQPSLTLEINPGTSTLIEARGKRNRAATSEEQQIVNLWREDIVVGH